eukprot:CAMPEP_0201645834 /NCGR_PEP_ID=MMETSP0493-20130528/32861_1 /ASSEMBLY_ACC=CAM_ASM_000838 /TAXON_ID=420259 /ORGANISM="Thalassiosira gravida, Strain GMp14c1" /LENGTH=31 /DNA_ID= /DNA_START= /DNA_END= /DNA_ORIENTATION=
MAEFSLALTLSSSFIFGFVVDEEEGGRLDEL